MHFLVALGIVLGPANTPVFIMRCPNVRKLQPRGRGHVVWKHAKNYACASFVLAIEGVGAPSFLRRYAADTVRGGGSFFLLLVAYLVSRIGPSAWKFLTSVVKEKKKRISLSKCILVRMFFLVRNKFGCSSWLKFESAKNQVKRALILASIVFGDGMFAIIEIFIVLRVFQRIS